MGRTVRVDDTAHSRQALQDHRSIAEAAARTVVRRMQVTEPEKSCRIDLGGVAVVESLQVVRSAGLVR